MALTTHPEYNDSTEGVDVAKAFASRIHGKSVLVTGVNVKGIGYSTAEAFASQSPAHLVVAGRNLSRLEDSISALKATYPNVEIRALQLDLASQQAVRAAAAELLSWSDVPKIDIVVNSAGVMLLPERTLSVDGIEMHFATNHIGHFLFTSLIMPKLLEAAKGSDKGATRIVNVSSRSPEYAAIRWSDVNFDCVNKTLPAAEQPLYEYHLRWAIEKPEEKSYIPLEGYNQSKVANVLFSIGANKRLLEKHGILSLTVHPGIIATELIRNAASETVAAVEEMSKQGAIKYRTQGAGAATSMVAALDPKLGKIEPKDGKDNFGVYLADCQVTGNIRDLANSNTEAERLWDLSEKLVKQKFSW